MTRHHTPSDTLRHELHRAYQVIFGKDPKGSGLILDRETLARTFRERAYQFRPDRAEELGRTRKELSEALKTVALAFDLLADVVGDASQVWVMPAVDEALGEDSVRPWAPRELPEPTKVEDARPVRKIEDATHRIKEAIGKLKAQTEALSRSRTRIETETPAPSSAQERPKKSLILGRHLHRRGLITLRQLIAAVAWQRAQRPAVGQIAKSWGILTEDQIYLVLREKGQGELFCDFAVRKGMMTPFQRLAVVGRQRVMQKPLGSYFIEQGILTEEQLEAEVLALRNLQNEERRNEG